MVQVVNAMGITFATMLTLVFRKLLMHALYMLRETASTSQSTLALWTHKARTHALCTCVMSQGAPFLRYRPKDMSDRFVDVPITVVVYFSICLFNRVTLSGRMPAGVTNNVHLAKTQSHSWKCAILYRYMKMHINLRSNVLTI